jgi:hypothetical protein
MTIETRVTEMVVTGAMVDAGIAEFREHNYDGDVRYMLEAIFRAMAYANLEASSKRESK